MRKKYHKSWDKYENDFGKDELQEIWDSASSYQKDWTVDSDEGFHSFKENVIDKKQIGVRYQRRVFLGIAASLALILISIAVFNVFFQNNGTILTADTSIKNVTLPDGSQVWLNKGATLKYSSSFNKTDRKITFSGEAYFDIVHNPKKKFIIQNPKSTVVVLGTAFNLRAIEGEPFTEVFVQRGKVAFETSPSKDKIILTKGFTGTYVHNKSLNKEKKEHTLALAWMNNDLQFKNLSLKETCIYLERYFKTRIIVDSNIGNCAITSDFTGLTLDQCIEALKLAINAEISKNGKSIIIHSADCK